MLKLMSNLKLCKAQVSSRIRNSFLGQVLYLTYEIYTMSVMFMPRFDAIMNYRIA